MFSGPFTSAFDVAFDRNADRYNVRKYETTSYQTGTTKEWLKTNIYFKVKFTEKFSQFWNFFLIKCSQMHILKKKKVFYLQRYLLSGIIGRFQ